MTILFLFARRAALETWKHKLGSNATYNNLIGVFETAGYQDCADTVRDIFGMYLVVCVDHALASLSTIISLTSLVHVL